MTDKPQVRTPITVRFGQEYHLIGSCNRDDIPMFVAEFKERVESWDAATRPACSVCGFEISEHDADPIGAGLTQYTCPEPTSDRYGNPR